MKAATALACAVALGVISVLAILVGAPDWVIAVLLGAFGLMGFLSLAAQARDPFDIEEPDEASE